MKKLHDMMPVFSVASAECESALDKGDMAAATAAQNVATLMGSQMPQVMGTSGSATTVDVNRYRGMMGTIFSNMSSIKGSSPDAQSAMTSLMGTMTTTLSSMPMTIFGQPFLNMSAAFRGSMMGTSTYSGVTSGTTIIGSGMM